MKKLHRIYTVGGLMMVLLLAACAAPGGAQMEATAVSNAGPIEGTWIDATIDGDAVTIPLSTVESAVNVHFSVPVADRTLDFMAYVLGGIVHVRANACPPCHSRGFALDDITLVCDACATLFDARDGSGIEGACVGFPKADSKYAIENGLITMSIDDLTTAYDETLVAG